jgi:hypothetical protein
MIEKRASADVSMASLKANIQLWRGKFESSEASCLATSKKHKGEIDSLKIKEKEGLWAASTSSKLVGNASRELIGSNADKIF